MSLRPLFVVSLLALGAQATWAGPALPVPSAAIQETAVTRDLVQRGRELLDKGDVKAARELFEQADAAAGGVLETRIWLLRTWMEQGQVNDALNEIDRLRDKGAKGPGLDYLYGMGSYSRALRNQAGGMNNAIGYAFADTVQFLTKALKADPKTYYDAWVPLTHSSWASAEFQRGREVGEQAVAALPNNGLAHYWLAMNLFKLFNEAYSTDPEGEATTELIQLASKHFDRAADLIPATQDNAIDLHRVQLQRGWVAVWRKRPADSHAPFAEAIGWEPSSVDYGTLLGSLSDEEGKPGPFVEVLTKGSKLFEERWGKKSSSDATLLWWLGYGQLTMTQYPEAEQSYLSAVKKWPAYADSFWYAGLAQYYQEKYVDAVKSWAQMFPENPEKLVQLIGSAPEQNIAIARFANAKANEVMRAGDLSLNVEMAKVAEAVLSADSTKAEHWNDVGLFCRDAGAYTAQLGEDGAAKRANQYWERSWEAYQKAIELAPNDPAYLNDGAVVLHYNLRRDFDKAEEMYIRSAKVAQELIDSGTITDETQLAITRTALKDAQDNLAVLRKDLEEAGK